ncbi:energy transducer TonB [bacterium]|nr:energy transducer TonB [bacterium]
MINYSKTKITLIMTCATLILISLPAGSGLASAQSPVKEEVVKQNLLKPERIAETCPMPTFPATADTNSDIRGAVLALLVVDSTGYINSINIRSEQPKGLGFGDAVKKTVRDWKYKPAYWQGNPVIYNVAETFYFEKGKVWLKEADKDAAPKKLPEVKVSE